MTSWIRQIRLDLPGIRGFLVGTELLDSSPKCVQENYLSNITSICLHLDIPDNKSYGIKGMVHNFQDYGRSFKCSYVQIMLYIYNNGIRRFKTKAEVFAVTKTMFDYPVS
jgi:hypothetical protein